MFEEMMIRFSKMNLLEMNNIELAKFLRDETKCSLREALKFSKLIHEAHRLGVVRGRALK